MKCWQYDFLILICFQGNVVMKGNSSVAPNRVAESESEPQGVGVF